VTNRRQFIEGSAALAAATLAAGNAAIAGMPERSPADEYRPERFVFDRRFAASVDAAELASQQGVRLAETSGDVTRLWYEEFDPAWKRAPMTLAGVTTGSALFVLETLARDRSMRVVERGDYATRDAEPLVAWTIAPRAAAPTI
jgi:hypothetical protein